MPKLHLKPVEEPLPKELFFVIEANAKVMSQHESEDAAIAAAIDRKTVTKTQSYIVVKKIAEAVLTETPVLIKREGE